MTDWLPWLGLAFGGAALAWLVWWLFIETEGVYLGRRVVILLYDLFAAHYDDIKGFRREYDHMFLAQPIMERLAPLQAPRVLDVATGTARLPLAMVRHAHFNGHVVALDLSRRMLVRGAAKLAEYPCVDFVLGAAETLPFPDASFDVVTCLEALEFMERQDVVLREIVRVVRPGGLLLLTNRISTRLMPGKTQRTDQLAARLAALGIEAVEPDYWQVDYERVWGRKRV